MAASFKITDHNETAGNTIDLTSVSSDIRLVKGSFEDELSVDGEPVRLKFQTISTGADEADARAAIYELERVLKIIELSQEDKTRNDTIWLRAAAEGSETPRRTLLLNWHRKDMQTKTTNLLQDDSYAIKSQWMLQRQAYWEAIEANEITKAISYTPTDIALSANIKFALGRDYYWETGGGNQNDFGSVPARIKQAAFYDSMMDRLWLGIKPLGGPVGNFNWIQPAASTPGDYATIIDSNGTTDNVAHVMGWQSHQIEIDFNQAGAGGYQKRFTNPIPMPTTVPEDMAGRYLVLCHCGVDATSTVVRMNMFQTWRTDTTDVGVISTETFEDVYVENDEMHKYEMGVIQIPPNSNREVFRDIVDLATCEIGLSAEQLSGTGDLVIDAWYFIPFDHFLSLGNIHLNGYDPPLSTPTIYFQVDEDGVHNAFVYMDSGSATELHYLDFAINNWQWPVGPTLKNTIVAAGDVDIGDPQSGVTYVQIELTVTLVPRYYSYNND